MLSAVAGLAGIFVSAGAYGSGRINTTDTYVQPSDIGKLDAKPNTVTYYVACFDNEGWTRFPINCGFKLWISYPPGEATDPMVNGGHMPAGYDATTAGPRPLIYRQRHYVPNSHNRPTPVYDGPGKLVRTNGVRLDCFADIWKSDDRLRGASAPPAARQVPQFYA